MTAEDAEKIINDYGTAIVEVGDSGNAVGDVFSLPCSPAKIKYAYFVYAEALVKQGVFNDDISNTLASTYAMLETKFVEEPEEINKLIKEYAHSEEARTKLQEYGGLTAFGIPAVDKMVEFNNFIADLHGNWKKK